MFDFDATFFKKLFRRYAVVIFSLADNSFNAAVDNHFGTDRAGSHPTIQRAAVKRNTLFRRLANCVLLGMNSSYAMVTDRTIGVQSFLH